MLPPNPNRRVTYENSVINSSQDNEQKHVYIVFFTKATIATLTLDLVNQISIGVLSSLRAINTLYMKAL